MYIHQTLFTLCSCTISYILQRSFLPFREDIVFSVKRNYKKDKKKENEKNLYFKIIL